MRSPDVEQHVAAESFQRAFYPKLGFRQREEFANMVKPLRWCPGSLGGLAEFYAVDGRVARCARSRSRR